MMKNRFLFVVMLFTALTLGFASCEGNDPDDTCTDYVDLGLSVKWATCNVGASSPEETGCYFAWGETTPKTTYTWRTYKWCYGSYKTLTKYCTESDFGTIDNKTVLDLLDDAAVNMGFLWRMPTKAEQDELREKCTWKWSTLNGVEGYYVKGPNGNAIFLPAAGYREGSDLYDAGSRGFYWSSSLCTTGYSNFAYSLDFNSGGMYWDAPGRCLGGSVRGVTK